MSQLEKRSSDRVKELCQGFAGVQREQMLVVCS
jgi:hypothetical protein